MLEAAPALCPPAYRHVPEHVGSYGDEVVDLAESCGLPLDPEQRDVLDGMYAHDARGRLVSTEFGCAAPRQNVKTHVGKAAALADLVLFDEPLCLWTAQLRSTSSEVYANSEGTGLADLFENLDFLRRLLDRNGLIDSDGEQVITLRRPSVGGPKPRLRFAARSSRAGRGLTGRRVTFDEALFLKAGMTAAMVPVLSAQSMTGAVQVRYFGSAGLLESVVWREVRDRGRRGDERRLAWFEWTARLRPCGAVDCDHAVGSENCALDDPDVIASANLALHRRIDLDFVRENERASMTPAEFMAERLCIWDDPPIGGGALDVERWAALADQPSAPVAPSFGVDLDEAGTAYFGAAWRRPDGLVHVQLAGRSTASKLQVRADELTSKHGGQVFAGGPAAELLEDCEPVSSGEFAAGCRRFADLLDVGEIRHSDETDLNESVATAKWRPAGADGAKAWQLKDAPGIGPLAAVTRALQGLSDDAPVIW